MTEEKKEKKLFNEFPPVTTQEWEDTITRDLKGADYNKKLVWNTKEGFTVNPYYRDEDLKSLSYLEMSPGEFPYIRGNSAKDNDWLIRQDILVTNAKSANVKALDILNKGVNSLNFILDESVDLNKEFMAMLLQNIDTNAIELNFTGGMSSPLIPKILLELDYSGSGSLDIDPLDKLNRFGRFCVSYEKAFDVVKDLIVETESMEEFKIIAIHGDTIHNAGSGIVQELAYSLSMGAEYLTKLTNRGLKADLIARKIKFHFATGSNYFMEIAKIRAARFLWSKILISYGIEDKNNAKMYIHSTSSNWNKTIYDPQVNILRTTTEAMSAIIGGTDSLTVEPYNKAYEKTNDFSERIARNQHHLLKEESYLDKTIDPSAGSYYIENLTNSIIENSWDLFLKVDEKGGYLDSLIAGIIQKDIEKTAINRDQMIAERKKILLGTNQYPNFGETISSELAELEDQEITVSDEPLMVTPLNIYRGARAFEDMRYKTDMYALKNNRPIVFMLTIGNLAMRRARSQFASNFFGCAGFEIIDNNGFKNIEEGVAAAESSSADIVVICSSDDYYAEIAPKANTLLLNDKRILVVAGAPSCMPELIENGISNFINIKTNILDELKRYQQELNIG